MNATTPTTPAAFPAAPRRRLRAGAVKRCPTCATPLDGGPVRFRCDPCGRSVMAADLDNEYHPANPHPADHPAESLGADTRRPDVLDSDPARTVPDGRHAG